ncbi:putative coil containing protein [Vibrio phage 501E54-1]|nr:putative coil containing protein [Vibrio phage 501E54-1]
MFDSKLHLQGLSLEGVIQQGITGSLSDMTAEDWKYLENLVNNSCKEGEDSVVYEGEEIEVVDLPRSPQGSIQLIQDDWTPDDSELPETLEVILAGDNDVHIRTVSNTGGFLRFRNMIGGGKYPNTHFALRTLYDAMQEDMKNGNDTNAWGNAARRYGNN